MGFSKLFFCSLIFIVCISNLSIHSLAYVSINNITVLGDAYFQENGRICLTPYPPSPSPSPSSSSSIGVGRALYSHPIRFLDPSTNSNASFICRFSFYITPFSDSSSSSPPLFGDGLTFIITSKKYILGSGFGYMGLSNETSQEEGGVYIAVEFDTSFNPSLEDISDNHIGIDINSVMSFASVDSTSMGFDLKNGKRTTVWIEYIDSKKMVKVWLSYTKSRTIRPILATHIDGKGSAQHVVEKWRFRTYGFLPSVNSFDTRVEGGCFMCVPDDVVLNGSAETPSTSSRKNELVLGVGLAAFFVSVLLVIGGISFFMRKKRNGDTGNSRHQPDDTDLSQVPQRLSQVPQMSKVRGRKTPKPKPKREDVQFSIPTAALTDEEEKRLKENMDNLNQRKQNVKPIQSLVSAAQRAYQSAKMRRVAAEAEVAVPKLENAFKDVCALQSSTMIKHYKKDAEKQKMEFQSYGIVSSTVRNELSKSRKEAERFLKIENENVNETLSRLIREEEEAKNYLEAKHEDLRRAKEAAKERLDM